MTTSTKAAPKATATKAATKAAATKAKATKANLSFVASRGELAQAIGTASKAVSGRHSMPVLAGLRLTLSGNTLELVGTDMEVTITTSVQVEGSGDGTVVIPAKLLDTVVRSCGDKITVEADRDGGVTLTSGEFTADLKGLGVSNFPEPKPVIGEPVTVDAVTFLSGARRAAGVASRDEARPILTGVLVENEGGMMRFAATDSYRLSVATIKEQAFQSNILIPARLVDLVSRMVTPDDETMTVTIGDSIIQFTVGSTSVTGRPIEGEFPNYRKLSPLEFVGTVSAKKTALTDALRRVGLLAGERPVTLSPVEGGILLKAGAEPGKGQEKVEGVFTLEDGHDDFVVAFDAGYLADGLRLQGDEVLISISSATSPAIISTPGEQGGYYLIMPVRI